MQQGIGRAGYLLLSFVLFGFGLFGLGLTYAAFTAGVEAFFVMGLGVTALAMSALWLFASFVPRETKVIRVKAEPKAAAKPTPKPVPTAAPKAPKVTTPVAADPAMETFEFEDYQPAAPAAPEALVVPPAFAEAPPTPTPHASADPAAWPNRPGKSTWTQQQEQKAKIAQQVEQSGRRQELTQRYTQTTPTLRAIMDDVPPEAPERIANRAPGGMNTDFVAPGMSVGRCGQCQTTLLAPEERPIRLKCPECAKVTRLD